MFGQQPTVPPTGGQPGQAPASGAPGGTQPEELSLEKVSALVREAEERAFRRAQGLIDSTNAKVQSRVNDLESVFKSMEAAGTPVSESAKTAAIAKARDEVIAQEATSTKAPGQGAQQSVPPQDVTNFIAEQMMKEAGVTINEGDPEVALLDMANPYAFIKSLPKAIEAARVRTSANQTQPAATKPPVTPGSNFGGSGGGDAAQLGNGYALLRQYWQDKG